MAAVLLVCWEQAVYGPGVLEPSAIAALYVVGMHTKHAPPYLRPWLVWVHQSAPDHLMQKLTNKTRQQGSGWGRVGGGMPTSMQKGSCRHFKFASMCMCMCMCLFLSPFPALPQSISQHPQNRCSVKPAVCPCHCAFSAQMTKRGTPVAASAGRPTGRVPGKITLTTQSVRCQSASAVCSKPQEVIRVQSSYLATSHSPAETAK